MTKRKITVVQRPVTKMTIDTFCWCTGEDKHPHKIGFINRKAVVEKIDDENVRLTDPESEYYTSLVATPANIPVTIH